MSSGEEDFELRDLLVQTLEQNGALSKIRAELRASTFLALEEDIKLRNQEPLNNLKLKAYLGTGEGKAMFWLVHEFLDFFNLQFTISVFESESYLDSIGLYKDKQQILNDLGLHSTEKPRVPLLEQLIKNAQAKDKVLDNNLNLNGNINSSYNDDELLDPTNRNIVDSDIFATNSTNSPLYLNNLSKKEKDAIEPAITQKNYSDPADNKKSSSIIKEDDTYEDTSSIADDSELLANSNNDILSDKQENKVPLKNPNISNKLNTTFFLTSTTSTQLPKTGLSSLTDLPPFSISKSRVGNNILPSLYSKEFKNKSNLKELDKMFDMEFEYEEDFIYSSNDLSVNTPSVNSSYSEQSNKMDLKKTTVNNIKDSSKIVHSNKRKKSDFSQILSTDGECSNNGSTPNILC